MNQIFGTSLTVALMWMLLRSTKRSSKSSGVRLQFFNPGHPGETTSCDVTNSSTWVTLLNRIPETWKIQGPSSESQPKEAPYALKLKQPNWSVYPLPMPPVVPRSSPPGTGLDGTKELFVVSNSRRRDPDEGRNGSAGIGTTTKPLEK